MLAEIRGHYHNGNKYFVTAEPAFPGCYVSGILFYRVLVESLVVLCFIILVVLFHYYVSIYLFCGEWPMFWCTCRGQRTTW